MSKSIFDICVNDLDEVSDLARKVENLIKLSSNPQTFLSSTVKDR